MITKFFLKRTKIILFFHLLLIAGLSGIGPVFKGAAAPRENSPILLEVDLMKASDGNPFGIRAEIINPDANEYLVLFAPWGMIELFHVVLFNESGYAVSSLPVFSSELAEAKKDSGKYIAVAPVSRRFVRLPIPAEVRADPTGLTNGKLIPISRGKYRVLVTARGVFFKHHNSVPDPGARPDYKNFYVTKDLGWVDITPEYADIVR